MKKHFLLIVSFLFVLIRTYSQSISFTDNNLKLELIQLGIDTNGDKEISFTEALAVDSINIAGSDDPTKPNLNKIINLTGLEAFVNLVYFDCHNNSISGSVDFTSNSKLKYLDCSLNSISSLNLKSLKQLQTLNVFANNLTKLDITNNSNLVNLEESLNNLTDLDVTKNINLESLTFLGNSLTKLNLTNNTKLKVLTVSGAQNNLTELDVTKCIELKNLTVSYIGITSLDLSKNKKLDRLSLHFLTNITNICVWQLPLSNSINVLSDLNPIPFTVCNATINDTIKTVTNNVDSVYNLISGNWSEIKICGWPLGCDSIHNNNINKIERIIGTDSITWKVFRNDTLLNSTKYLLSYSNSSSSQRKRWMLVETRTNGSINNLLTINTDGFILSSDFIDANNTYYSRTKDITGMTIQFDNSQLLFSPNPTKYLFSISGIEHIDMIKILNINGKLIQSIPFKESDLIDISQFPNGIYIIQAISKNKKILGKVIKN